MRIVITGFEKEYHRYKGLADASMAALAEGQLNVPAPNSGNSVCTLARHLGGNLASRFTDFLESDGEKPWRNRETEFDPTPRTREEVAACWESGWAVLFATLATLDDGHLMRVVRIRAEELTVAAALTRSLSHAAYHVGQIVQLARMHRGESWQWLSIPPGGSQDFNESMMGKSPAEGR